VNTAHFPLPHLWGRGDRVSQRVSAQELRGRWGAGACSVARATCTEPAPAPHPAVLPRLRLGGHLLPL